MFARCSTHGPRGPFKGPAGAVYCVCGLKAEELTYDPEHVDEPEDFDEVDASEEE